jgi:hypothetical protein
MVLAHVSGPTSLLHCPNEVVSNIFWHVNDSGTLTNIALTCKLLNALVKPKIFESCPVIENQDHLLSLDALDSRFARFSSALSDSNAPLIRHLLLPIKAHVTNEVGTMLQKCVNLDRVTLYTSSDGIGPHEAPDYLSDKVKSLTLRIVPFCYTEDIQRARARFPPVERDAFDMLKSFTRVTSLRVLVEPSLERNPIQVWNWIATTTKHLQITTLHTNVAPDATGDYAAQLNLLPDLQSMSLDFWQPKFDFPSSHCSSPRECPGRFISRRGLFRLMASEEHRQWKYNLAGTHVILNGFDEYEHERYEVKEFWDKIIERNNVDIFNNWVSQSGLQLLVHCDQREDPTTHSIINCGHPNVYLDIAGYELSDLDIEGFLTKVVPTTRALFVDTTVLWGSELCRSSVSEMFRHVAVEAPDFQLQHLQNFPPTEFAACHSNFCFEDARAFQPLSVLPTLTSIDLDMAYFTLGTRT